MGKGKSRKPSNEVEVTSSAAASNKRADDAPSSPAQATAAVTVSSLAVPPRRSVFHWLLRERQGIFWVVVCCLIGCFVGFGTGSGVFTGQWDQTQPLPWRMTLGTRVRETSLYQLLSSKRMPWAFLFSRFSDKRGRKGSSTSPSMAPSSISTGPHPTTRAVVACDMQVLRSDPSHPNIFAVLREAVVREKGGFVHPDLGILQPAPSGAARGLGMLRDTWHQCQTSCFPGVAKEKLRQLRNDTALEQKQKYKQEEVLVKVPLTFQMTRAVALETLLPLIPTEVQRKASIHELDDAALLVLLLAHERGVGKYSRWLPYIASLPLTPSCGYSKELRPYMLDSLEALKEEVGLDVNGWVSEMYKATQYSEKIATGLARDYGSYLQHPKGMSSLDNIQWALCQVASRATAGSQQHGSLRLIPLMDMINHDGNAGGFVELTGEEKYELGDFVDDAEEDAGAFTVRSLRHGRRKALKVGQELLVNYNVPHYSALDWFISLGFVPPERWNRWQKMDAALPRMRRDGPFSTSGAGRRTAASFGSEL